MGKHLQINMCSHGNDIWKGQACMEITKIYLTVIPFTMRVQSLMVFLRQVLFERNCFPF